MKKISILLLVIVAALASCKKVPEVNLKYVDVERDLITVGTTQATIQCDYEYIATLKKAYFHYGEGSDTANMTSTEMRVVQKTLYVELSDLKENTNYSYYYEFANGFNSMKSATRTFKTEGPGTTITMPTVVTSEVTKITSNSAKSGGEVTNDGGAEVTERGICWSTNENPAVNDNHVAVGEGIGAFTEMINGLEANTTYHVRAYATNSVGTAYGLDKTFTTLSGGGGGNGDAPEGAINGLFSVSATTRVYFSQGNLQYQASTDAWRFAENQYDCIGNANSNISSSYSGWIDLFGWGTSGWNSGANCYQPWSTSTSYSDYYPGGSYTNNLTGNYANADWGVYNAISNGGNTANTWRTLTKDEWVYVFNTRTTSSGIRYAKACVNNVNGVILLPDDWSTSTYSLSGTGASFASNTISSSQWATLEQHGAVFLPAAGNRYGTSVYDVCVYGNYWSVSYIGECCAYNVWFNDSNLDPQYGDSRYGGHSVRLVRSAQ